MPLQPWQSQASARIEKGRSQSPPQAELFVPQLSLLALLTCALMFHPTSVASCRQYQSPQQQAADLEGCLWQERAHRHRCSSARLAALLSPSLALLPCRGGERWEPEAVCVRWSAAGASRSQVGGFARLAAADPAPPCLAVAAVLYCPAWRSSWTPACCLKWPAFFDGSVSQVLLRLDRLQAQTSRWSNHCWSSAGLASVRAFRSSAQPAQQHRCPGWPLAAAAGSCLEHTCILRCSRGQLP